MVGTSPEIAGTNPERESPATTITANSDTLPLMGGIIARRAAGGQVAALRMTHAPGTYRRWRSGRKRPAG